MYPFIKITSDLSVPTYYLVLSAAVCVGLWWSVRRADEFHLERRQVLDLSLLMMVMGFIGGRLLHVLYEEPQYYKDHPEQIIAFWNGGFVFYGGALLAGFSALFFAWKKDRPHVARYADLFAPVIALIYALGRGACLLAGCCYGRTCELPWAISGRHPTQAYASLWEIGGLLILLGLEKKSWRPGFIFSMWLILHGLGRLIMEAFRDDFRGPTLGLSISSWISVGVIGAGVFLVMRILILRPKPAGDGKGRPLRKK